MIMRLIDADRLIADSEFVISHITLIKQCGMKHRSGCFAPTCEECFARRFKNYEHLAPTVDAEPVKHGKWLLEKEPDGTPYCFHCSVCDEDFSDISITTCTDYCPNCGAKMDGGNDNA